MFERITDLNKDEYYQVILDGTARYLEIPFLHDLARTLIEFTGTRNVDFADALGKNQIASKKWLLDELQRTAGGRFGTVYLLGGWYGLLGAMLLFDPRFEIEKVVSFDLDPACEAVARSLNATHVREGRFEAATADIRELDYRLFNGWRPEAGTAGAENLLINTSCEHLPDFAAWYERLPSGALLVLQSNDLYDDPEHVNCVADIAAFRRQASMSETLLADSLKLNRYSRFMLVGRR